MALRDSKGNKGIALLIINPEARWWQVVNDTPRSLYPRERDMLPVRAWDWMGPRFGLDGCGLSRFHRHSIPGPPRP